LPAKVRETLMLRTEYFTEGHARTLLGISDEEHQIAAMNQIIAMHLSVRQAEELVARIKTAETVQQAVEEIKAPTRRSPEIEDLEHNFRDALMVKVDLKYNNKGKGTIVLHFNSQDELETLYQRLVKRSE
jgi:ParB family chromosome partitioning protein